MYLFCKCPLWSQSRWDTKGKGRTHTLAVCPAWRDKQDRIGALTLDTVNDKEQLEEKGDDLGVRQGGPSASPKACKK